MKFLILLSLFIVAGCSSLEGRVVSIDSRIDTVKDKAVVILIEEHRALHEKMTRYIEWAEREQVETTERLERLRNGLNHD